MWQFSLNTTRFCCTMTKDEDSESHAGIAAHGHIALPSDVAIHTSAIFHLQEEVQQWPSDNLQRKGTPKL